jgi:transposase
MSKLKSTLRLYTEGKSKRFIASYLDISRNTVIKYISRFTSLKLTYEDLIKLDDRELYRLFQMPSEKELPEKLQALHAFFPRVEKQLKRPGVTRLLMWGEYISKHPGGYSTSQFYEHYKRWRGTTNPSMRIDHKAGDKMQVDYAGKKLHIIDKRTGELCDVEVFVSILGASQLIYCEATQSQKKEDFVTSTENALLYYGGVPRAIVPDNLKSAVTKSHRYEPTLNETFEDFAEHYSTTVLPARVYKPKDKALVEGAVKIIYTAIYTKLQDKQFFSLEALNKAIHDHLEALNDKKMTGRPYSRREVFDEIEADQLAALPKERYQIKEVAWATVMKTGHVMLQKDKHHYSIPYRFIGKKVRVVYSPKEVRIYYHHELLAAHKRTKSPYNYTTVTEHLASTHKFIAEWNPEFFLKWARGIDPNVELVIKDVLDRKKHPEQAYRSCIGILSLSKKVGRDRLANACQRALEYGVCNYKMVQNILEKGLDQLPNNDSEDQTPPSHGNIRGKKYYG